MLAHQEQGLTEWSKCGEISLQTKNISMYLSENLPKVIASKGFQLFIVDLLHTK